jgi:putative ABC transport system permease protein
MTIGNAMTAAAVALNRLGDELTASSAEVEARLSLGATAREAAAPVVRRSLVSGMINVIDSTKSAGLVFFPGTMVGMILAGAAPLNAVRLQLILFYLLVGGVAISVVIAVSLAQSRFFTDAHQLRDRPAA